MIGLLVNFFSITHNLPYKSLGTHKVIILHLFSQLSYMTNYKWLFVTFIHIYYFFIIIYNQLCQIVTKIGVELSVVIEIFQHQDMVLVFLNLLLLFCFGDPTSIYHTNF